MLSSVWRPKNPVSLIFSRLFFSLQYKNLEKPYPTNCTKRSLKAYTSYTVEGCFFECKAEIITKKCGCRLSGYTGMMYLKQETTNHWVTHKNPVVTAEKKMGNRGREKDKRIVKNTETLRQQQQKNSNSPRPQFHSYLYHSVICRVYNTRNISLFLWPWLTSMSKINWIPLLAIQFNFLLRSCFVLFFLIKVHLNTSLAQPWRNICVFTKFRVSNPVFGFSRVLNVSLTIKGLALAKILNLFLYYFCFCWRKVWGWHHSIYTAF